MKREFVPTLLPRKKFAPNVVTSASPTIIVPYPFTLSKPYHVLVPHGKKVIEGLMRAGGYDFPDPDITDDHFPVDRDADLELDVLLAHFDLYMESDDVVSGVEAKDLVLVIEADLLALGVKYPNLQRDFPIVELGQSWQRARRGPVLVGVLGRRWRDQRHRDATLRHWANGWPRDCRFAVRCK